MNIKRTAFVVLPAAALLIAGCVQPPPPPAPPVVDTFSIAGAPFTDPALVSFVWSVHDVNNDALTCRIDGDSDGTWDLTVSPCQYLGSRNLAVGEGSYTAILEVSDGSHPPVTATAAYEVSVGPTEPYGINAVHAETPDPRVVEATDEAIALWESVIVRGVPDVEVHRAAESCRVGSPEIHTTVDDLLVFIEVVPELGAFGGAETCVNGPDGLPRVSWVFLNEASITWFYDQGYLDDLIAHELGHALGFTGTRWMGYRVDTGAGEIRFAGPRAVAEWSRLGGEGAIPLDDARAHWSEPDLQGELMTCYLENHSDHPLSTITAAAMADIGYNVDLSATQPYMLPAEPAPLSC